MAKKIFFIVTLLLVAGVFAGWYFFAKESRYLGTSPLKAIPATATTCIKIRNLGAFVTKTAGNRGWKSLAGLEGIGSIHREILYLDSLMGRNKHEAEFLYEKECYFVRIEKTSLYLLEIGSIAEKNGINVLARNYFLSKKAKQSAEKYKGATLQKFEWVEANSVLTMYLTLYRGVFIAGRDVANLRMAVDQMDQPSLLEDSDFLKVNKNTAENTDLNIFVSHPSIKSFFKDLLPVQQDASDLLSGFSGWTEIDVLQKDNGLILNGFTVNDTATLNYQDIFRRQKPMAGTLTRWMPSTTTFFASQCASDPEAYVEDYFNYQRLKSQTDSTSMHVNQLSALLNLDIKRYLATSWTGEAATVFTNQNMQDGADNQFLLMKIRPGSGDALYTAIRKWASIQPNQKRAEWVTAAKNNIWRVPSEHFGKLAGDLCFGAVKTGWITAGDGFLLMGSTPGSLKRYLDLLQRDEVLVKSPAFANFASGLVNSYNFYLWCAPGQVLPFFEPHLNPDIYHKLEKSIRSLEMINNFSWQWVYENGKVYNSAALSVEPEIIRKKLPFWSYTVEGRIVGKPVFISFEKSGSSQCLIFQREDNTLISLGKDGLERWRMALQSAIVGEIGVVRLSGNGESQLLFNTSEAIHLLSQDGAELKNFPIRLKSRATNGVAMFDYEDRGEYRFMVACSDHKIYNFDRNGKLTTGWKPKATVGLIEFPVHHFKDGSKDYIVCFDKFRTYIMDRQGNTRVKPDEEFEHSANDIFMVKVKGSGNIMVTTDKQGNIRMIKFDGSSKKIVPGKFSKGHFFSTLPVDQSGNVDFLVCDTRQLSRFDSSGRLVFAIEVPFVVDQPPSFYHIGQMVLIGLTSNAENRSILLSSDGTVFDKNLSGNRLMAVGAFDGQDQVVNLVEWKPEGFLSNYQMRIQ